MSRGVHLPRTLAGPEVMIAGISGFGFRCNSQPVVGDAAKAAQLLATFMAIDVARMIRQKRPFAPQT
jgi:hypothetical protein